MPTSSQATPTSSASARATETGSGAATGSHMRPAPLGGKPPQGMSGGLVSSINRLFFIK